MGELPCQGFELFAQKVLVQIFGLTLELLFRRVAGCGNDDFPQRHCVDVVVVNPFNPLSLNLQAEKQNELHIHPKGPMYCYGGYFPKS